jgi:FkbM family methyltransferase
MINPFLVNKRIDLVDFDDLKLFMLEDDNSYRIAVPGKRKHQNLENFQKSILTGEPRQSFVTPANAKQVTSARYGIFLVMYHLWSQGVDFDVFDIGSHIGDFGLKVASFIRTHGKKSRVVTFDPSEAGALVPYSIEINRLENIIKHEMLAVSDMGGLVLFQYRPGHSDEGVITDANQDATSLASTWIKRFWKLPLRKRFKAYLGLGFSAIKRLTQTGKIVQSYSLIARSVDVLDYVASNKYDLNLFVKIDIEGYDPRVINRLLNLLPQRKLYIIFEFAPLRFTGSEDGAKYLKTLSNDFHLFDLYFCPNPTRIKLITPDQIDAFVVEVSNRRQGYTDIFMLDKRTPACALLLERLAALVPEPDALMLVS